MDQTQASQVEKLRYRLLLVSSVSLIAIASIFYHLVEKLHWLDAVYLSVITITTVGYGDITPQTDAGKVFTIIYVLLGIGIIATFASSLARRAGQRQVQRRIEKDKKD